MVKVFQLVRGRGAKIRPMNSFIYASQDRALKEMKEANKQFREFNVLVKQGKISRKPIELVRVREISYSRKKDIDM
jgi:hypothetical protein